MTVRIVTDSTCYIPAQVRDRLYIDVVSLGVAFADASFREMEISDADFYRRMAAARDIPTSTQPPLGEMIAAFQGPASAGEDVVGVFLSSEMSGTYENGLRAVEQMREGFPERRFEVVDSRSNCMELGFAVLAAAEKALAGGTAEECAAAARHVIDRTRFLFVPATLDYLRRGGRIGGASALLGAMLQIRPILTVVDGRTEVWRKVRTSERARREIVGQFAKDVEEKGLVDVVAHHIDDPAGGEAMAAMAAEVIGRPVESIPIGPVIGLHVGPGTAALAYLTERPMRKGE